MRPQRKIMMVEATYAFVKLKQIKAAVSAGGIKFEFSTSKIHFELVRNRFIVPPNDTINGPNHRFEPSRTCPNQNFHAQAGLINLSFKDGPFS